MTRPGVTAITVTYQTGACLKDCLYALDSDPDIDQILIVDNGNPQDIQTWLEKFAETRPQVELIPSETNLGFGSAVNLGAARATSEQLLIINPDAIIRRGSIRSFQETATALAVPWIIGGRIFDTYGKEQRGPRRRELTLWRALSRLIGWNTWTMEADPPPTDAIPMPVISGAFFLTSKQSFDLLGGFDEGYFLHLEDVDLCKRCWDAGGVVMYDPRPGALHYGATSHAPKAWIARHKSAGLARYLKTHRKGLFEAALIAVMSPLIRTATRLRSR